MITDSMRKFSKEKREEFSESLTDDLGPKQYSGHLKKTAASKGKISNIKKSDGTITNNGAEKRKAFANFYEKIGNEDTSDEQKHDTEFKMLVDD
eukprot:Awhi_evm1s8219